MNLQKSKLLQIIQFYVNIPPINPKFQTLATVGHIHPNFPTITENEKFLYFLVQYLLNEWSQSTRTTDTNKLLS